MEKRTNSMSFTPEEKNEFRKFLLNLTDMEFEDRYNEIHVWNDGFCDIIDWECVPFDHEYGGKFEYVDWDQEVVKSDLDSSDWDPDWVPISQGRWMDEEGEEHGERD